MSESVAPKRAYNKSAVYYPELDAEDLKTLEEMLPHLTEPLQQELLQDLAVYEDQAVKEKSQTDFLTFVKKMWPDFIMGRHHKKMAKAF